MLQDGSGEFDSGAMEVTSKLLYGKSDSDKSGELAMSGGMSIGRDDGS